MNRTPQKPNKRSLNKNRITNTIIREGFYNCTRCILDKPIEEFTKTSSLCKSCRSEYNKEWRIINKPKTTKISLTPEQKRQRNLIKQRERRKKYRKNIDYCLQATLRSRVYLALKKGFKSASTMQLIGCDIEQFKKHISAQFVEGMSWENHGKWEIDHIKPCSHFDLTNPNEQRVCFHYTNCQPLWMSENRAKCNRFVG